MTAPSAIVAQLRVRRRPIVVAGVAAAGAVAAGVAVSALDPRVAFVPLIAIASVLVWARMPGVLLALYLFLPFYKAALGPLTPVDLTPVLALANASQVIFLIGPGRRALGPRIGLVLWLVLGIVVLAGVLWASRQALAIDRAAYWWLLILLPSVAAIRVAASPRHVAQFVATAFTLGVVVAIAGLPSLFGSTRLAIIAQNTLQTGSITLMLALLTIFWLFPGAPRWVRLIGTALAVVAILESIASGSRGPLLAFGVALLFGLANRLLSGRPLTRYDVGVAALAGFGITALAAAIDRLPSESLARLLLLGDAIISGGSGGTSITAREDLYEIAWSMFVANPLLGGGTGSFAAYTATLVGFEQFHYPHNNLLQIAAEFGVVGASIFVAIVLLALLRQVPQTPAWTSVKVLLAFSLTISLTSGDIYGDRLLWGLIVLVLAAPVALVRRSEDTLETEPTAQKGALPAVGVVRRPGPAGATTGSPG